MTATPDTAGAKSSSSRARAPKRDHDRSAHKAANGHAMNGKDETASRAFGQGALIGAAAAGLMLGLAATIGRRAAVQAGTMLKGDWLETLKAEHQAALRLFDRIEATSEHQTTKRALLLMQLKHALAKHAFEEENVIYPALRDHGEGDEADHLNHDHGYVKQFLFDLAHCPSNSPAWIDKARAFRAELEKHIREEEETIFPALHARLDQQHNSELTTAVAKEGFKLA